MIKQKGFNDSQEINFEFYFIFIFFFQKLDLNVLVDLEKIQHW